MTAPLARHAHHRLGRINDGFPAPEPGHDGTGRLNDTQDVIALRAPDRCHVAPIMPHAHDTPTTLTSMRGARLSSYRTAVICST